DIWLDAGYADYASMRALFAHIDALGKQGDPIAGSTAARLVPVFGSESLRDPNALHEAEAAGFVPILSLDHRAGHLLAAAPLAPEPASARALMAPAHWPAR
ncbi:hypothetical protein, partial [Staphylococcus gallinarum]|uniref:hypothetical protein n=1 Tax=Staphylococcus gallinarum TaxID=1293 RepID=UPI00317A34FC